MFRFVTQASAVGKVQFLGWGGKGKLFLLPFDDQLCWAQKRSWNLQDKRDHKLKQILKIVNRAVSQLYLERYGAKAQICSRKKTRLNFSFFKVHPKMMHEILQQEELNFVFCRKHSH